MAVGTLSRAEAAEAELRLLPGVIAARCIWPETAPAPELVRLLAEAESGGHQLVDAARTLLSVRFETDLPEERVLLLPVAATPERSRFRLDGIELVEERRRPRVKVTLTMPILDQPAEATREFPQTPRALLGAASQAVVDAINEYLGHTFDLEAIANASLGPDSVVLCALRARVRIAGEPRLLRLYGVASDADEPAEAVARATLDAANRIFR
ncbi:MAG: hypothetical protein QJR08_06815 [Bacillota bacterium]|nr:hypothetical protein [Bacillota bacterium]